MKELLKYLGVIILLAGVVCLVIYALSAPHNWLLVTALVLEALGILTYIIVNKYVE